MTELNLEYSHASHEKRAVTTDKRKRPLLPAFETALLCSELTWHLFETRIGPSAQRHDAVTETFHHLSLEVRGLVPWRDKQTVQEEIQIKYVRWRSQHRKLNVADMAAFEFELMRDVRIFTQGLLRGRQIPAHALGGMFDPRAFLAPLVGRGWNLMTGPREKIGWRTRHTLFLERDKGYAPNTDTNIVSQTGYDQWMAEVRYSSNELCIPVDDVDSLFPEKIYPKDVVGLFQGVAEAVREGLKKRDSFTQVGIPSLRPALSGDRPCERGSREPAEEDSRTREGLKPCEKSAYRAYLLAAAQMTSEDATEKDAYEWLKEHGPAEYQLPGFFTWQRYLRKARKHYDDQKTTPQAARTGRSIQKLCDM